MWNLFGKTKDTYHQNKHEVLFCHRYLWDWWHAANYYREDETRLMKILAATDSNLPFDHMMQLSVEDSALIEKWQNRIENKDET